MSTPRFIDIEFVELEGAMIPAVIAWSLPDGRIKSAQIEPDADWLDDSDGTRVAALDALFEEGIPARQIVLEMQHDLGEDTLYHDGLHEDEALLEMVFAAAGKDLAYEVLPIADLLDDDQDEVDKLWQLLVSQQGLSPDCATDCVYGMLLMAKEYDLLEVVDDESLDEDA